MKGENAVDKLREEVKNAVSTFIEKRLTLSRELQDLRYKEEELFDLDVYITLAKQYDNLLEDLYKKRKRGEEETILEKDGQEILMYDAVKALKKNLRSEKIWKARFSDDNIKDIINLVRHYFDIIDFSKFGEHAESTNENFFLRGVLSYIRDYDKEEYAIKASRYLDFFYAQDKAGFNNTVSGCISIGYNNLIDLSNADNNIVFTVNNDKEITVPYSEEKDYFLFGNDIVFGLQIINGKNTLIPARKIIRDGKVMYNPFLYGDLEFEESDQICEDKLFVYYTLKDLLYSVGLESYYEKVYKIYDFMELVDAIRGSLAMSDEDKEKVEEVAKIAADWWISVISILPQKDAVGAEEMANVNFKDLLIEDKISSLRESIKLFIKKTIMGHGSAMLSVDYGPDFEFRKCIERADVQRLVKLPWKTSMIASLDEITVKYGYGAKRTPIFKRGITIEEEKDEEVVKKDL